LRAYFNNRFEALNSRAATFEATVVNRLDAFSDNAMDIFTSLGRSSSKMIDGVERLEARLDVLSQEMIQLRAMAGRRESRTVEAAILHRQLADLPLKSRVLVLSVDDEAIAQSFAALGFDVSTLDARSVFDETAPSAEPLSEPEPYDVVICLSDPSNAHRDATTTQVQRFARPGGRVVVSQYTASDAPDPLPDLDVIDRQYLVLGADRAWHVTAAAPDANATAIVLVTAINSTP
jgi:hypothetical protein